MNTEKYLRPEVIRQVARLDLRAKFIVEGFLSGLHASPFHGFSVEFSEHRKYVPGEDIKDLDWNVYAKTERYYVKKFQAETNMTGYLVMDLSASMAYTYRQEVTEFEDPETREKLPPIDARGMRQDYQAAVEAFRQQYREECAKANIDYVPMDTSVSFDKALLEYLIQRQRRF